MKPISVSQTGVGSSAVIPMDTRKNPFNVGLGVAVTGTVNYTVQHTFEDAFSPSFNAATAVWFNHPTLSALAANTDSNYAFAVRGIRLTVNSGTGTAKLTAIQAG